jgi:hypothetical protein
MASGQSEDERDLALQEELQQALQSFLKATGADRDAARANFLTKLREFSARVLKHPPSVEER